MFDVENVGRLVGCWLFINFKTTASGGGGSGGSGAQLLLKCRRFDLGSLKKPFAKRCFTTNTFGTVRGLLFLSIDVKTVLLSMLVHSRGFVY